jgi:hypothetical protein
MRKIIPLLGFTLLAAPLVAQVAVSGVTGFWEVTLEPGQQQPMAPVLLPWQGNAWSLAELAGDPNTLQPYGSTDVSAADQLTAGEQVFAAWDNGMTRFWTPLATPGENYNSGLIPDTTDSVFYSRMAAASPRRLGIAGRARLQSLSASIAAGQSATFLAPDGRELLLSKLGLQAGDSVIRWNTTAGAWETISYDGPTKTYRIGSRTLTSREVAATTVKPGTSFTLQRSGAATTAWAVSLPSIDNTPTTISQKMPIIDIDRDGMADAWEQRYGGLALFPTLDADSDGFTNQQEYRLGGDPTIVDSPALPRAEVRVGDRTLWVSYFGKRGCNYRLETRRASDTAWRTLGPAAQAGTGTTISIQDTSYTATTPDRTLRYYRVLGLAPSDVDKDGLSDWEEENVYRTNPALADTDGDGVSDPLELKSGQRDPLEYYNGRVVKVSPVTTISQYAPVGEWLREALTVKVTASGADLKNAPVDFLFLTGSGKLDGSAGGTSGGLTRVRVKTDSTGTARAWAWLPTTATELTQIAAVAVVPRENFKSLYATSFALLPTPHVNIPLTGLTAWYRADRGLNTSTEGELLSWSPNSNGPNAEVLSDRAPKSTLVNQRAWLAFTGKERLQLNANPVSDNWSVYFAAAPTEERTSTKPSLESRLSAGNSGQRYLFGYPVPTNGDSVLRYKAPEKPSSLRFSLWEQKDFFLSANFPQFNRPYIFAPGSGRIDNTFGYRVSPAPVGNHSRRSPQDIGNDAARSKIKNYEYEVKLVDTKRDFLQGRVWVQEDFYEVRPTTWKGNASSSAFGGVAIVDRDQVGTVASALSVGKNSMGAYELRNGWHPAVSGPVTGTSSQGFIGAWHGDRKQQALDLAGASKNSGLGSFASRVYGPSHIGGTNSSSQGYVGNLGDVLFYNARLNSLDHDKVMDYLGTVYRGKVTVDSDRDKMPDWWERAAFGAYDRSGPGDSDEDGLTNVQEYTLGFDPSRKDTDGDGLQDKEEYKAKRQAALSDSDGDLWPDANDPLPTKATNGSVDADANGKSDAEDYLRSHSSAFADVDADGTADVIELLD